MLDVGIDSTVYNCTSNFCVRINTRYLYNCTCPAPPLTSRAIPTESCKSTIVHVLEYKYSRISVSTGINCTVHVLQGSGTRTTVTTHALFTEFDLCKGFHCS